MRNIEIDLAYSESQTSFRHLFFKPLPSCKPLVSILIRHTLAFAGLCFFVTFRLRTIELNNRFFEVQ